MKSIFVVLLSLAIVFGVLFFFNFPAEAKQAASPACPNWIFQFTGTCLTPSTGLTVEAEQGLPFYAPVTVTTNWSPDRWLVQFGVSPQNSPFFGGIVGANKYSLKLLGVYTDERVSISPPQNEGEFDDGLSIFAELVCDSNGETSPKLSFSMPKQTIALADGTIRERKPRSMMIDVVNWEITQSPCQYK